MSTVHLDRFQRRVCANPKQTPISLFSAASILARVEVSNNCRHKLVDQSQALSETAAIYFSSAATNGSQNTFVSFRAFVIIREMSWSCHGVVFLSRCCHCRTYSAANACSNLGSSGAMMKNLSSAVSLLVSHTIPPITFSVNGLRPVRIWWRKRIKVFWCLTLRAPHWELTLRTQAQICLHATHCQDPQCYRCVGPILL